MIKKYIKKPVEIEAVQWTGDNIEEIYEFVGIKNLCFNSKEIGQEVGELYIKTLEGDMHVAVNDYIIKGIKGEFYPCKPDIFHDTYTEKTCIANDDNGNKAVWIESKSGFDVHCNDNYKCSNCGNKEKFATFFCSHCGKEMTSDKEIHWKNWK